MAIENTAKITNNPGVNINRNAIEHRATWMGLIYQEALKAGADAEAICRAAIKRCGNIHGAGFKAMCDNPADVRQFRTAFLPELGLNTFEMEVTGCDEANLHIDFHYCALVNAWKKLGFDDETCAKLCDIAMDGDRGIAEAMGYTLDLTDTIAKGCATCKLHFHK
ncbi:L-2-amino-thiazoline-4-carboxylic acid hydrolase [Bacillota bacterium Meth-B3]|nr:L-2-amino-thiazoline-4-carboxylic acid hydrolase [Christensenellaceae bacterium]MEA5064913.1 L-2-amino-thiazoline-4-carboxylic acid hydrolase [Eubacteriales bacterium]MEA5067453.1 L-2-amino-thiazoline-4-carboxylic acid hydrolase [Christensenellaceae bacterium]